ncbi:hypothetical protein TNCV_1169981 [Trichonephila clavipes]|nr:hypothetical protein TNCV_1169981 [Trichonephila clavipes]
MRLGRCRFSASGKSTDLGRAIARESFSVRLHRYHALTKKIDLFYQIGSNHLVALQVYRRLKDLQKGPISRIGSRKMNLKFGDLGVLPGRGKKPVGIETVEVATAVIERACSSIYSSASSRSVSRELEMITFIL